MPGMVREMGPDELGKLLDLYRHLHPDDPDAVGNPRLPDLWEEIYHDPNLYLLCIEKDGIFISSCTLAIIKNLTRNLRPYALIEHVITHPGYRKQGLATSVLHHAIEIAKKNNCYKVMLMTSSKKEETLHFYEKAGFKSGVKTGFIINF